MLSPLVTYIR